MYIKIIRLPFLGAFLLLALFGQRPSIPHNHPNMTLFYQEFRQKHNLSTYQSTIPFNISQIPSLIEDFPLTNTIIGTYPSLRMGSSNQNIQTISVWCASAINNWSMLVEPVVVNDPFGQPVLGTAYVRSGVSGRFRNALLRYNKPNLALQLGRGPLHWGQSWNNSIIHSFSVPTYDHLSVRATAGQFQLEIMAGQLGADTTEIGPRIKRLTGGHRLTWKSRDNRWFFGFGEQVVYTGENRSWEMMYLNPFIPYFFSALEGDEYYDPKDSDNSVIFLVGRYVFRPDLSVYGEILVDDFQVDVNNYADGLGIKLGADGATDLGMFPVTWEVEFTRLDSWVYIHYGQSTSWWNRGHAIGYPYGPDAWSVSLTFDAWIYKNVLFSMDYIMLKKGSNILSTYREKPETKSSVSFPMEPVISHKMIDISLEWWDKWGIVSAGWSNTPFANEIAYDGINDILEGGFYFKYQFVYQKGFNIKGSVLHND